MLEDLRLYIIIIIIIHSLNILTVIMCVLLQVHQSILPIRKGKDGWIDMFCPGGISCFDEGHFFSLIVSSLLLLLFILFCLFIFLFKFSSVFIHWHIFAFLHFFIHLFVHSFIHSLTCSSLPSFLLSIHPSILPLCIHSTINPSIHSVIHLLFAYFYLWTFFLVCMFANCFPSFFLFPLCFISSLFF